MDTETLDAMAERGIKFTVLSPHQAAKIAKLGGTEWEDVSGGRIDPTKAYLRKLPSGRDITLFSMTARYRKPWHSRGLLKRGEDFVSRLKAGLSDQRHMASDAPHSYRWGNLWSSSQVCGYGPRLCPPPDRSRRDGQAYELRRVSGKVSRRRTKSR